MRLLSEAEYKATMEPEPMRIGPEDDPPFDFWPYFDEIPEPDLGGPRLLRGQRDVRLAHARGQSPTRAGQLRAAEHLPVLVLDLSSRTVLGHYLLDIYGV